MRDYIHIDDVLLALLRVMGDTGNERVFNIGSGKGVSVSELLDTIERIRRAKDCSAALGASPLRCPNEHIVCRSGMYYFGLAAQESHSRMGFQGFAEWMKQKETGYITEKVTSGA